MNIFKALLFTLIYIWSSYGQSTNISNDKDYILIDQANTKWIESYNKEDGDINKHYTDQALVYSEKGDFIRGKDKISVYYNRKFTGDLHVESFKSMSRCKNGENAIYDMGSYTTDKQETYEYLIVWKRKSGTWLRDLEYIVKKVGDSKDISEINNIRNTWLKLCNEHNPKNLIESLYDKNAIYYFSNQVFQGHSSIISAYSYASNSSYSLNLTPKSTSIVQPGLAFEIGQYKGQYNGTNISGYYILVWKLTENGEWKIIIDADTY